MPPKTAIKTPAKRDLPAHVSRLGTGYYKYQRRVPKALQEVLDVKVWDFSLGRDKDEAYARALALKEEHDALIANLSSTEEREAFQHRRESAEPAKLVSLALVLAKNAGAPDTGVNPAAPVWRQTEDVMQKARLMPRAAERDRLALFAAYAFGDRTWLDRVAVSDPFGEALVEHLTPARPAGAVEAAIWDAVRAALAARLDELAPPPPPPGKKLSSVLEAYIRAQALRMNTARGYTSKVDRLITFAGDGPLGTYTESKLREYRDHLLTVPGKGKKAPMKPASVLQSFAPLKAVWKFAADEYPEYRALTFPRLRMAKVAETVEETRWQAFSDDQIRDIGRAIEVAWAPDSRSRLTPSRRAAFHMAVRVLLYTGLRPSEVFRLTAGDVDSGEIMIRHTKTKAARRIPLSRNIADFPEYLAAGGFEAEMKTGIKAIVRGKVYGKVTTPESMASTLRDAFHDILAALNIKQPKLVLYSLKDTLVERLQRQGASDDVIRGIIGHTSGQGKLRHYKTPFGQSPHGMAAMRAALDSITYW